MADDFGVYDLTARLETLVSSSIYGALAPPSGNINLRRRPERLTRDNLEIAAVRSSSTNFMNVFLIPEVSSSQHEVQSLNAFFSGSELVEGIVSGASFIPNVDGASKELFYSKRTPLIRRVYALTASALLPTLPASQDHGPAVDEYGSRAGTFHSISGSYRNTSVFNPSVFEIDVPDRGKIRDIRVWVELIHDHRGGTGTGSFGGNPFLNGGTGDTAEYKKQGLQGLQIALRSPNVNFDYAHPLWNEPTTKQFEKWPTAQVSQTYRKAPEILRNSYLLWAGHACEEDLGHVLGAHTGSRVNGDFFARKITSSSFGPGISGSSDSDASSNYAILATYGAYRTLASTVINGTTIGVMYPTLTGAISPDIGQSTNPPVTFTFSSTPPRTSTSQHMLFVSDFGHLSNSGTLVETDPFWHISGTLQIFQTASFSDVFLGTAGPFYFWGPSVRFNHPRIRVQKNSLLIHAACLGPGIEMRYGIRQIGDANAFPWRIKAPIITAGNVEYFPPGAGADSFMDFALDSNGKPHFVGNAWRGDLGVAELNYWFFSGSTATYQSTPAGTTLVSHAGDGVYPKKHDFYTRAAAATSDLYPDFMFGTLDNAMVNSTRDLTNPPGSVGAYCRIEIDKNDVIHVVYADTANHTVKYAKKSVAYQQWSGSWSFETVFKHPVSSTWPTYISLDIDSENMPHVAYALFDGFDDNIYYARSGSTGWSVERVAKIGGVKHGTNIRLDNNGIPVIVTSVRNFNGQGDEGVIVFRSSSESGWGFKPVYSDKNDDPRSTTVAFDVNNRLRIYTGGNRLTGIWEVFSAEQGKYFEYDTDIDIRTVFSDSSKNLNPRNLSPLYESPSADSPGESKQPGLLLSTERAHASPFSASMKILQTAGVWGAATSHVFDHIRQQTTNLTGSNCPWMLDTRVPPGIYHGLNYFSAVTSSVGTTPPPGWLTGPGGAAGVNEFPTAGPNLGPADIQPVYPLLDDVFVEKIVDQPSLTSNAVALPQQHGKIIGFRPGLRGTEANGKWKLLIGVAGDVDSATTSVTGSYRAGFWFRQVRLEMLLEQGEDLKWSYPSKVFRFKKSGSPRREGRQRIAVMSGSAAWDVGVNYIFSSTPPDHGRSFGITDVTGSTSFAVFAQLTGTFVDILSGSGKLDAVKSTFLSNEFGTPYIPLSSGSAEIPSFDTFDISEAQESRRIFQESLNPKTLIPQDNTLRATLARSGVIKSTRDHILSLTTLALKL